VDFVQADRLRRMVAGEMARLFDTVDLLIVPSLRDEILTISNHTGHPSLTLRAGPSRYRSTAEVVYCSSVGVGAIVISPRWRAALMPLSLRTGDVP